MTTSQLQKCADALRRTEEDLDAVGKEIDEIDAKAAGVELQLRELNNRLTERRHYWANLVTRKGRLKTKAQELLNAG